jgi:glycosyltransferase involved in cell wall biosynthesis
LHYFRILRERGYPVWLIVHERTRAELLRLFPDAGEQIRFIPDTLAHRLLWRASRLLPRRLSQATAQYALRLLTQIWARGVARKLVARERIDVVHQPIPVSPREPSALSGLGAPVVIGPMNGAMEYPPAFRKLEGRLVRVAVPLLARLSGLLHRVLPGKLRATTLLVANERTRGALPHAVRGRVVAMVENGVDLALWQAGPEPEGALPRFVYLGRLVDWKALDLLLHAFAAGTSQAPAMLEVIGDGPMRASWTELTARLGLAERVSFTGWLPQAEAALRLRGARALVLPSLYECGGAVVLEAMASAVPVIATRWGGPADYLDEDCGILVDPTSREVLIDGFRAAIEQLARSPDLRRKLGEHGRRRAPEHFDWNAKVDRMLEIYAEAVQRFRTS